MSDIIERLHGPDGLEAGQEILRLREENARLREENWELVARAYALLSLLPPETTCGQVQEARAKLAAIREGGK